MKFGILRTLMLAMVVLSAGCGNLTEPQPFSFATLDGVPPSGTILSAPVIIQGNQFPANITFDNFSSQSYSQILVNGAAPSVGLRPGDVLQLQQSASTNPFSQRTTTIRVGGNVATGGIGGTGGFTANFTTVTGGANVQSNKDASGNTATISNVIPAYSTSNGNVTFTLTASGGFGPNGIQGDTVTGNVTVEPISNSTGQPISGIPGNFGNIQIPFGSQGSILLTNTSGILYNGTLPSGLPSRDIFGNQPNSTAYWSSLIAYWRVTSVFIQ